MFWEKTENLSVKFFTLPKIEGYFKITLPKYLKRVYRTREGLIRWIRLQKIRWTKRNVITHQSKNSSEIQLKNQKIKATS